MVIYLIVFCFFGFLQVYNFSKSDTNIIEKREKKICFFCAAVLIMLAALRGYSVGTDTLSYVKDYELVRNYSYKMLFARYIDNPGYYLLSKVFSDLGISIQIWFGIVAFIYVSAVYMIIKTYSKDKAMSFLIFMVIGGYGFSLAGLKQAIAMGLDLWAFIFLMRKKNVIFFILFFVGLLFHKTSIAFLFAFALMKIKNNKYYYAILGILFVAFVFAYDQIITRSAYILNDDHLLTYVGRESSYSATSFIIYMLVFGFSLLYFKRYVDDNFEEARAFLGMSMLGAIMLPLAFAVSSAFRISLYFSPFLTVFLPNCLAYERYAKNRRILKLLCFVAFVFYFVYVNRNGGSIVPYRFYWQSQF